MTNSKQKERKMPTYIYAYNAKSAAARDLAKALKVKRIRHEGSKFKPTSRKMLINWGSSELPSGYEKCTVLNKAIFVGKVSNKRTFFQELENKTDKLPPFTTDKKIVKEWLEKGKSVCVRQKLTGHSAEGLSIFSPNEFLENPIPDAPLYTQYIKKKDEFRIHVINNSIVDIQRKALRTDEDRPEEPNFQIRSHANGFIFTRNDERNETVIKTVCDAAVEVLNLCELDFGAVDVVYNSQHKKAYVLEINTAPGLEGTTIENYAEAFKELM